MAGFYPNVPGHKMALDRDGTQWFKLTQGNVPTALTSTEARASSSFGDDYFTWTGPTWDKLVVVFPEKRDLAGLFFALRNEQNQNYDTVAVETSTDTTNGVDGTWSVVAGFPTGTVEYAVPAGRSSIQSVVRPGIRGVKITRNSNLSYDLRVFAFHAYGSIAAGASPDRLAFWHPTLDQEVVPSHGDWGDVMRNTSAVMSFRVKNLSPSKTSTATRVALESLFDTTPTVLGQHALSLDGSTYLSQVNVGNLAPGVISPVVYLRRITPVNAVPSLWDVRAFAEATSWT